MSQKVINKLNIWKDNKAKSDSFYLKNPYTRVDKKFINFLKNFSKKK